MNRNDIIHMAREAGCLGPGAGGDPNGLWEPHGHENVTELMFKFAALVAASEREALEKIDWTVLMRQGGLVTWGDAETLGDRVIDAIRARGNP